MALGELNCNLVLSDTGHKLWHFASIFQNANITWRRAWIDDVTEGEITTTKWKEMCRTR